MIPVVFGGCRGWLHPAEGVTSAARAVVLCPPQGYEALCTHRGWCRLAEHFAASGLPTLRFDYPGTGDSVGDEAPRRLPDWLDGIDLAADWIRHETGLPEVALCGLRLGALLAAASAARRPGTIAALALLAPPASGRAWLRHQTLAARAGLPQQPADWLEHAGFRLHDSDLTAIPGLDLGGALERAGTRQVLLACPARQPALGEAAVARLRSLGASVKELPFEGYDAYLRDAHASRTPEAVFARVAAWSLAGAPRGVPARPVTSLPTTLDCPEGAVERIVQFGRRDGLFGVLCQPAAAAADPGAAAGTAAGNSPGTASAPLPEATAVLMLNTGANHWIGNGRMAVRLGRRLASLGVASFRMDATGIGNSYGIPASGAADQPPALFGATGREDVRAALDALEMLGFPRCIVLGVCSGAHDAFQAAVRDPRIIGLALANLPAFDRHAGGAAALDGGPPPGEVALLRRPRMLLRRLAAEADRFAAERLGLELGLDQAGRWVRLLRSRGTSLLLVYSAGDRALRELRAHFGRNGRHLPRDARGLDRTRVAILGGSDHSLNPRSMQDEFLTLFEQHLRTYHGLNTGLCRPAAALVPIMTTRLAAPVPWWRGLRPRFGFPLHSGEPIR